MVSRGLEQPMVVVVLVIIKSDLFIIRRYIGASTRRFVVSWGGDSCGAGIHAGFPLLVSQEDSRSSHQQHNSTSNAHSNGHNR